MADDTGGARSRWATRGRAGLLAAAAAGTGLLVAACGGSHPAASQTSSGQLTAPKLAAFAACMRSNGVPGLYFSGKGSSGSGDTMFGYNVPAGINPGSPQFQSGLKVCRHILGLPSGPPPGPSAATVRKLLQAAKCMRAHGYPGYPDPAVQNGELIVPVPPAGIDQNSPQFQAAQKTCQPGSAGISNG